MPFELSFLFHKQWQSNIGENNVNDVVSIYDLNINDDEINERRAWALDKKKVWNGEGDGSIGAIFAGTEA